MIYVDAGTRCSIVFSPVLFAGCSTIFKWETGQIHFFVSIVGGEETRLGGASLSKSGMLFARHRRISRKFREWEIRKRT